MSNKKVILLVAVGCVLLAIANVSMWATRDLFNSERFGDLVTEGLQSDEATEALAGLIVDQILANNPDIPAVVRIPAGEIVAALLQRPAFTTVLETAATAANVLMTTNLDDVVSIDLETVVPFVVGVVTAINPESAATLESVRESEPLKLLGPDELPRLKNAADILPWLWPLTAAGAIALFVGAYWWAAKRRDALTFIGLGVVITGVLALLFIPAMRQSAQTDTTNSSIRVIVGEVVGVFMSDFATQTLILIVIGLVVIGASRYILKEDVLGEDVLNEDEPEQDVATA